MFEYTTNSPNNTIINYTDSYVSIDTITLNSEPYFTSTEITSSKENLLYTYDIEVTDEDSNDTLKIIVSTAPSWLNFTDNEDGTATLEGTPLDEHVGNHSVVLELTDGHINTPVLQSFSITVEEDEVNSIEDIKEIIDIYPNPVINYIFINFSTVQEKEIVAKVYDFNGKLLIKKTLVNNKIDVTKLSSGNYILQIKYNENIYNQKFIKK